MIIITSYMTTFDPNDFVVVTRIRSPNIF